MRIMSEYVTLDVLSNMCCNYVNEKKYDVYKYFNFTLMVLVSHGFGYTDVYYYLYRFVNIFHLGVDKECASINKRGLPV